MPSIRCALLLAAAYGLTLTCSGQSAPQNEPRVPTRITPPARSARPAHDAPAPTPVPARRTQASAPDPAQQPRTPAEERTSRVIIRHSVDPETIVLERELDDFYLPIVSYSPWDPYSSTWALNASYLARRPYDRENLRQLYNFRASQERGLRLRGQHADAVRDGVDALSAGQYHRAALKFQFAAEVDQGEPLCRVYLALARIGLSQFESAGQAMDRALDLQPKLAYVDLQLNDALGSPDGLARLADALREHLATHAAPPETHKLLGFLRLQNGEYEEAARWFNVAAGARPNDAVAVDLAALASGARE